MSELNSQDNLDNVAEHHSNPYEQKKDNIENIKEAAINNYINSSNIIMPLSKIRELEKKMKKYQHITSEDKEVVLYISACAKRGMQYEYIGRHFDFPAGTFIENMFLKDKKLAQIYINSYMFYVESCHQTYQDGVCLIGEYHTHKKSTNVTPSEATKRRIEFYSARTYLNNLKTTFFPELGISKLSDDSSVQDEFSYLDV